MTQPASGAPWDRTLSAALDGAEWARTEIYVRLGGAVLTYFRSQGIEDPEAATNDVFVEVFRQLSRFEGNGRQFRSWVFTIAHGRVADERRSNARRQRSLRTAIPIANGGTEAVGDAEQEALDALSEADLASVISRLSPDQRDVVLLRIVADLPIDQVAHLLGKQPNAIKALQHRAIGTLRRLLRTSRSVL